MIFTIKTASEKDIDLLVEMRINFNEDIHPCSNKDEKLKTASDIRKYFLEHYKNKSYIGYLGFADGKAVASAGILIYTLPPLFGKPDRIQGHLFSVYTAPGYRKMGYADQMMKYIIQDAKERKIFRLFLNATKMGEGLYRKNGFHEQDEVALIREL
jgi:ribosomal protein S18 acetylase RimI-like enzyme